MSRRLLIFGINYAPEPTGTALPTIWWSELAAQLGWETSVITGVPHYPSWRRGKVPRRHWRGPVRVVHRSHYIPRRQSALRRGLYELTWVLSALPEVTSVRPDAVLGVVPSLGGAVLAATAAARYRVPYALLFQDLMGRAAELGGIPGAGRVAGVVESVELALARRATGLAIIAEGFRPYFLNGGVPDERIHRVRNPARLPTINEPRERVRQRLGWSDGQFVVLHSGSMGYKQGLDTVVEAAAATRSDDPVLFVFQGDGNQREALQAQVSRLGLHNVRFLPLAADEDFGSVLASADALLLNQRGSVVNMSLPAKLASYFAAGVPVLAAVSDADEVAIEVGCVGAGIVVRPDDPHALLGGSSQLRLDPERAHQLGDAGARFAQSQLDASAVVGMVERFLETAFPDRRSSRIS